MSKARRQHFIPRFVLNNFTDDTGHIYYCRRSESHSAVVRTTPTNVFVEKDLYSIKGDNNNIDVSLEHQFSRLEHVASQIVAKILLAVRVNELPKLSRGDRIVLNNFVYYQWKRVSDVVNSVASGLPFERIVRDGKREIEAQGGTVPLEEEERLYRERDRLIHNAKVAAIASSSSKVMPFLQKRGLKIFHIGEKQLSLAIGSNPIVRGRHNDTTSLDDLDVEVILPIAPDTALVLSGGSPYSFQVRPLNDEHIVRDFNENVFRQSKAVASPSRQLLVSLVDRLGHCAP
ncbi:MAG: DUF4238 domain-containing protein [Acidobacteria bacterium]|nr:DUF4238 domain-containing protein [Acidobacteriota bacterium]MYA45883.1 DUF4238 domain-containing protein [Acidobacteriota bacterium]MYI40117.1 DUF4238 domain-containing protein [Acidobacteriota bacterium]